MADSKPRVTQKELDRKFEELKKRVQLNAGQKLVTRTTLEEILDEKIAALIQKLRDEFATKEDLRKLDQKLDWLVGAYKKFDEEHTLLSNRASDHEDRLEVVEGKLGIAI